jgi:uncharacterized protein (DUF362 family)
MGTAVAGLGILNNEDVLAAPEDEKPGKSKVVLVTDKSLLPNDKIDQKIAERMIGQAITKLTGKNNGPDAWKSLFSPTDVVGIKVNCLFGKGVSTHPEIAYDVVTGLTMAGVKPDNIIIWDRSTGDLVKCGYIPNKGQGVKVLADDGDWGDEYKSGAFHGRLSKIITQKITAIVNVPILKTHGMAGISCALKNHYGSFDNPGAAHGDGCNPWLADLNALPQIKDKTRLIIVDAARPQCDGGPGLDTKVQFNYFSILAGKDPLAIDRIGLEIINEQRKKTGKPELTAGRLKWFASATKTGVGVSDLSKIDLIRI